MKYHKIPKIDKAVCTAEQKVAYNLAFSWREIIKNAYDKAETGIQKSDVIHQGVSACMRTWEQSYTRNEKYNKDAIFCALNEGLEKYINGSPILCNYDEIGKTFKALYLFGEG